MSNCPICSKWEAEPENRIAELKQTYVSLNRDQFFPGYCFVYTKEHVTELFHLDEATRNAVMAEVNAVAKALHGAFHPDKINYELLGNMAPHMHWHVLPRHSSDPLWPRPHWSEPHQELVLSAEETTQRVALIRSHLERG
ncbi:HIT family protein [Geomesophilobacter sediminis]|uniref:HIT family protein n=1 Tax=Geomesophilobacter sediminis TaxID=2798584 RepID=A0A8J7S7K1_9BACT|nr:HIT family protein [Geomesophilobacter sediminis]MBJ6726982.1 HIT family protein [Geomesophilobacter sediminis]